LFSQDIPSNNLGFLDSKTDALEIEIAGHDYVVRQSPGLLNSRREEGTTGAVLWKITPLLAAWLASAPSVLAEILHDGAVVVELGCGIAGLIGLILSRIVKCYVLTDQDYVMNVLRENVAANTVASQRSKKGSKKKSTQGQPTEDNVLKLLTLDWEQDSAQNLQLVTPPESAIDLVILCDCVYNEYLVAPLVQTCVDVCRFGSSKERATVVLVAQQLRADTVFELFLESLMKEFDVWRIPDDRISTDLRAGSGYAVHLAQLKDLKGQDERV